jgi:hypothetical protein
MPLEKIINKHFFKDKDVILEHINPNMDNKLCYYCLQPYKNINYKSLDCKRCLIHKNTLFIFIVYITMDDILKYFVNKSKYILVKELTNYIESLYGNCIIIKDNSFLKYETQISVMPLIDIIKNFVIHIKHRNPLLDIRYAIIPNSITLNAIPENVTILK